MPFLLDLPHLICVGWVEAPNVDINESNEAADMEGLAIAVDSGAVSWVAKDIVLAAAEED